MDGYMLLFIALVQYILGVYKFAMKEAAKQSLKDQEEQLKKKELEIINDITNLYLYLL